MRGRYPNSLTTNLDRAIMVVVVCAGVLGLAYFNNRETEAPEDHAAAVQAIASDAKGVIADRVYDPLSAQYSDLRVVELDGQVLVCGHVNHRDEAGVWTGPVPFMVSGQASMMPADTTAEAFAAAWSSSCRF